MVQALILQACLVVPYAYGAVCLPGPPPGDTSPAEASSGVVGEETFAMLATLHLGNARSLLSFEAGLLSDAVKDHEVNGSQHTTTKSTAPDQQHEYSTNSSTNSSTTAAPTHPQHTTTKSAAPDQQHEYSTNGSTNSSTTAAPTSVPTAAFSDPPLQHLPVWLEVDTDTKCTGQQFRNVEVESQYDCEMAANEAGHPFYHWNERLNKCASCETGLDTFDNAGFNLYRNNVLWSLQSMSQKCTNKKQHSRPNTESQIQCQQTAMSQGHTYYQWNAFKKHCATSKKCKTSAAPLQFGTYKM